MSNDSIGIVKSYIEAYNAFDIDGMLANLHEDVKFENYDSGILNLDLSGIVEFKEQAQKAAQLFEERNQHIDSIIAEKNKVLVQIDYYGVLAQDLNNDLRKGSKLNMEGSSVFTLEKNKIIKIQDYT